MKQTEQMMLGTRKDYMSKIGDIRLQLDEAAERLGFESLEMAQNAGCEVEWHGNSAELVEPLVAAHRAWEAEKEYTIAGLKNAKDFIETLCEKSGLAPEWKHDYERQARRIDRAIKFIEEAHE